MLKQETNRIHSGLPYHLNCCKNFSDKTRSVVNRIHLCGQIECFSLNLFDNMIIVSFLQIKKLFY